jgi:hypothetical protein
MGASTGDLHGRDRRGARCFRSSSSSAATTTATATTAATLAAVLMAGCGGGGGGAGDINTPINDVYGPGSPSSCPNGQRSDVWFNNRLACLAAGQRFINAASGSGDKADRAYIFGQQALDGSLNNVLGPNVLRYFKYAVCVRNAPATIAPLSLAGDLATALGLNVLATGSRFYPPALSGSTFFYGGISDTNTLQTPCDPAKHPVIVNYDSGRIESVNSGALSALVVFDR